MKENVFEKKKPPGFVWRFTMCTVGSLDLENGDDAVDVGIPCGCATATRGKTLGVVGNSTGIGVVGLHLLKFALGLTDFFDDPNEFRHCVHVFSSLRGSRLVIHGVARAKSERGRKLLADGSTGRDHHPRCHDRILLFAHAPFS